MDRGQTTVVGKALEAGVVVLYIALLTTVLYGGAVPAYETAAGQSVADRTTVAAAERVQQAVPPTKRAVDARQRVDLPATIAGDTYEVRVVNRTLVLDHPDDGIEARARLALPEAVERVEGRWRSGEPARVRVQGGPDGVVVRLEVAG